MSKIKALEIRTFKFDIHSIEEEENVGIIKGYASVFNEPVIPYNEIVLPGAFKKTLKETGGKVAILSNHEYWSRIGIGTGGAEDNYGLLVDGEINLDVQKGREEFSLAKQAARHERPYGISIGFQAILEFLKDKMRMLKELKLIEWSLTSFPAAPNAGIIDIRSALAFAKLAKQAATEENEEPETVHSIVKKLAAINAKFKGRLKPHG